MRQPIADTPVFLTEQAFPGGIPRVLGRFARRD